MNEKLVKQIEQDQFDADLHSTANTAAQAALDARKDDPTLNPVAVAHERAESLVKNISSTALLELKKLRDEVDGLMRVVTENQSHLIVQIKEHADFVHSSMKAKQVITDALVQLQQSMKVTDVTEKR